VLGRVTWQLFVHCHAFLLVCYEVAAQRYSNSGTQVGNLGVKDFWTLASARALRLPSITSPGISNGSGSRKSTSSRGDSSLASRVGFTNTKVTRTE